jgi:2-polyprenyl-3-methyl-5-hydroxy-6-metoxy-1,4-benzoquinol methylase
MWSTTERCLAERGKLGRAIHCSEKHPPFRLMRSLDRALQQHRIRQALRFLPGRVRVIDVGAFRGELFRTLGDRLVDGWGVDPLLSERIREETYTIEPGYFPAVRPSAGDWDAITMLAVLEHMPAESMVGLAGACHELLRPGGLLILTVPEPQVDYILALLRFARLIDGMSLEEHHGFRPGDTRRIFGPPQFALFAHKRFQLGLNNLFVFEKVAATA